MDLLRELHRGGATICMVTHDPRYARYGRPLHPSFRRPRSGGKHGGTCLISKHIDFLAIGALLCGMAFFAQSRRVLLISPAAATMRIQIPRAPACPVVVIPNIPRIVVNI